MTITAIMRTMIRGVELGHGTAALILVVLMAITLVGCGGRRAGSGPIDALRTALPETVAGWTKDGPAELYDQDSIYSYIDGHAEVYLAYGMRRCLAQRYAGTAEGPGIVVDIFELATPADAYGVFTHDQEGEPVAVGNDALLRHGWLSLWKGPYFVSVYAEGEADGVRAAVLELAKAVAAAIPEAGERPGLVTELPSNGLEPRSVRYLHDQQTLNTVLFLSEDNVLLLSSDTAAVVARYHRESGSGYLLLVEYPDPGRRERAEGEFVGQMLGGRSDAPVDLDQNGWCAVAGGGRRLTVVLDADNAQAAASLLEEASTGGSDEGT